jgi:hypothetical protein
MKLQKLTMLLQSYRKEFILFDVQQRFSEAPNSGQFCLKNKKPMQTPMKTPMKTITFPRSLLLAASCILATQAYADDFFLQTNMPTSATWTNAPSWFDLTSGGGANPASFGPNDFFLNGFTLRTANSSTSASSFGGGSLNFASSTELLELMAPAVNLNNTVNASNGTVRIHSTRDVVNLNMGTLNVTGPFSFAAPGIGDVLNLSATTLTGAGDLIFGRTSGDLGNYSIAATTTSAFTGRLLASFGTLTFNSSDFELASLIVDTTTGSSVNLANSITLAGLEVNLGAIAAGTYTAAELNTLTSSSSFAGGSTLTVVPEPSTTGFIFALLVGATVLVRRRR